MEYFAWLEQTAASIWVRESSWAFFAILIVHSLAMGLVVGINIAFHLRFFGFVEKIALSRLKAFVPVIKLGFFAIVASGLLLVLGYPAKALTNPVFYLKMGLIAAGLFSTFYFVRRYMSDSDHDFIDLLQFDRLLASVSILIWCATIVGGRFLAYTHSILLASSFY